MHAVSPAAPAVYVRVSPRCVPIDYKGLVVAISHARPNSLMLWDSGSFQVRVGTGDYLGQIKTGRSGRGRLQTACHSSRAPVGAGYSRGGLATTGRMPTLGCKLGQEMQGQPLIKSRLGWFVSVTESTIDRPPITTTVFDSRERMDVGHGGLMMKARFLLRKLALTVFALTALSSGAGVGFEAHVVAASPKAPGMPCIQSASSRCISLYWHLHGKSHEQAWWHGSSTFKSFSEPHERNSIVINARRHTDGRFIGIAVQPVSGWPKRGTTRHRLIQGPFPYSCPGILN